MTESKQSKRIAVSLPEEAREFLETESKDTGVPLSNLLSYIVEGFDLAPIRRALNSCVNIFNLYGCF